MHQLTKDILFLVEFSGELDADKLNILIDNALNRTYNKGHADGQQSELSRYDRTMK